jgi:hypothetical protein
VLFLTQEIEEGGHRISDRIPVQRHVHGLPDENLSVSITGEVGGFQKPRRHAEREHVSIPRPVIVVHAPNIATAST